MKLQYARQECVNIDHGSEMNSGLSLNDTESIITSCGTLINNSQGYLTGTGTTGAPFTNMV